MDVRIRTALPGAILWTAFLVPAVYVIAKSNPSGTESFLMLLFAAFSGTIATEAYHELRGRRSLGTLKEFSAMTREELSMFNERRISVFNGILHFISAAIVSSPTYIRGFLTDEYILVPFFRMLIPMAVMLAAGSYLVNYSGLFKTPEGRRAGRLRDWGAAARTTFSLLIAIGACYGLAIVFSIDWF